ncbi:hypothetical protein PG996_012531 [Apiospora saccharicola]|uniref:Uncharacterized protein n=1 Tax=Apiospora saccharicola TaxID=335842 RepID=A0ABR1U2U9_9PEZI
MAFHHFWSHLLLLSVTFWFPLRVLGDAKCFYPKGETAMGDAPCNPKLETSACCGGGFGMVCLDNGFCLGPSTNIIRGSCTDANWGAGCSRLCLGMQTPLSLPSNGRGNRWRSDHPTSRTFCANKQTTPGDSMGGPDLISCANATGSDESYCCDHLSNYCDTGVGRFNIKRPRPTASWNTQASRFDLIPSPSSTISSSTSPTAKPTSSSGPPGSDNSLTTQSTGAGTAPQPTEKPADTQQGLSSSASAGIGVGVGLGFSALAVASYLAMRRYRKKKAMSKLQAAPPENFSTFDGSVQQKDSMGYWGASPPPQELRSHNRPQELYDQPQPQELPSQYRPQELPTDYYRG